jgi:hypothetical protein
MPSQRFDHLFGQEQFGPLLRLGNRQHLANDAYLQNFCRSDNRSPVFSAAAMQVAIC